MRLPRFLPKSKLPLDTSVQAEYADGFILDETEHNDVSPYPGDPPVNILRAILNKDPEPEHGKMVRFSVFWQNRRYDLDWQQFPDNARPIRFRDGNHSRDLDTGEEKFWWSGCRFGFQYTDEQGKNVQEVQGL
jgi:hypothetical protein